MKAHDDAQLGVLNVLGHQAVDGAPGLHARQVGQGLDDIGDGLKGDHAQFLKAQLKAALGGLHQVFKALHIGGVEGGNLREHGRVVVAVIKVCAVVKANAVERRHQAQIDMVFHVFAAQGEQLFDEVRHGDDGRASVEGEAVLLVHISAAPCHVKLFKHLDLVALDAEPDGGGQATKAGANDDGAGPLVSALSD